MKLKLQKHIENELSLIKGKRLLLAVSGGIDSMVLLHLFHELKFDIGVAHCNFQLRGEESDEDKEFVKSQCEKFQIPIYIKRFETKTYAEDNKFSIQIAARKLRYDWFETLLQNHRYDYLLTAHHLDDSLETFLINFTRGTGLTGLTGIPRQNDKIIRPLLIFLRDEIRTFAQENAILWREDSSNASDKYLRNKLRHDVIPVLKELNPGLLSSFENTIENLQQAQSLVNDASQMVYQKVVSEQDDQLKINISKLQKHQNFRAYLYQWLQPFGFTAWDDIYDLVTAQSGKQVFSESHVLLKDREFLLVYDLPKSHENERFFIEKDQNEVKLPLKLSISFVPTISNPATNTIFVDAKKVRFPLEIRKWQEGDVLFPLGMDGKKKLSKFFKDEKYSLRNKSNTWLLCSDNQIVWVIGKRQDDRFKTESNTTRILKIKLDD